MTEQARAVASARRGRSAALIALAVVLLFGAYSRLAGLGREDFWTDELFHVFAAQSLERGDGPRLPSGELYTRGADITRLVQVARRHVTDPEAAARLPSAVLGIAGLVILAAITWRLAGGWAATWATVLLAIFPVALQESRNTRFYTEQLVFGLIAMYAGWRVLEPDAPPAATAQDAARRWSRWGWVALTLAAFLAAARIQPSTLSVAAGWAVAVALFAAVDLRRLGNRAVRYSVPVQLTAAGVAGLAVAGIVWPGALREVLALAMHVPLWAQGQYSPRAYYWMLAESIPLVLSLLPVIFLGAARRNLGLAVYLLAWFAVPLALHSVVFRFQAERYVLLALPALFVATGIAGASACGALFRSVADAIEGFGAPAASRMARYAAAGVVGAVAATAVVTTPAFTKTRKVMAGQEGVHADADWRRALAILRATPGADTLPWGSRQPLPARFYWGRVDFTIAHGLLERPIGGPETTGPRPFRIHPQGTPDFYLGIPVLSTVDAIRGRFGPGHDVIIAVDTVGGDGGSDIVRRLTSADAARELCAGRCGGIRLYRWTLPQIDYADH